MENTNKDFIKTIEIPLYHITIDIIIANSKSKIMTLFSFENEREITSKAGRTIYDNTQTNEKLQIILNGKSILTHGIIAHEALHATFFILSSRGLKYSQKSEEAYTYLIQFIIDQIYKLIKTSNTQIK